MEGFFMVSHASRLKLFLIGVLIAFAVDGLLAAGSNKKNPKVSRIYLERDNSKDRTEDFLKSLPNDRANRRLREIYYLNLLSNDKNLDEDIKEQITARLKVLTSSNPIVIIGSEVYDRSLDAFGKMVEDHVSRALDKTAGKGIDYLVDRGVAYWTKLWRTASSNGKRPFTAADIESWKSIVDAIFDDIRRMLADQLLEQSRSADPTLRQGDDQAPAGAEVQKVVDVWRDLIESYVQQFEFLALRLEHQKGYYDKSDDVLVIFYADQIKRQLLKATRLLKSAHSLRELNRLIDSNKTFIEAMRSGLIKLFENLKGCVVDERGDGSHIQISAPSHPKSERTYGLGFDRDRD